MQTGKHWRRRLRSPVLIAVALSVAVALLYSMLEQPIAVRGGQGWDGAQYHAIATGNLQSVVLPYTMRIGVPYASRIFAPFTSDVIQRFFVLNLTLAFVYSVLLFLLLRDVFPDAKPLSILLAWLFINLSEQGPLRFQFWYPTLPDTATNVLLLMVFYMYLGRISGVLIRYRAPILGLLFFLGLLCRENFLFYILFPVALGVRYEKGSFTLLLDRRRTKEILSAVAGIVLAVLVIRLSAGVWIVQGKSSDVKQWLAWQSLIKVIVAMLLVYGPFVLFVLAGLSLGEAPQVPRFGVALFLAAMLVPVLSGGGNTERFLFWFIPAVAIICLPAMDEVVRRRDWLAVAVVAVTFAVGGRPFTPSDPVVDEAKIAVGCAVEKFLLGYSPHAAHWVWVCDSRRTLSLFLYIFLPAIVILLVRRVRIEPRWQIR